MSACLRRSYCSSGGSFDDVIRPQQQRGRDGEAQRLGGLQVDDEFRPVELLDWQSCGVRTEQDPLDRLRCDMTEGVVALAIAGQRALDDSCLVVEDGRQALGLRSLDDYIRLACYHRIRDFEESVGVCGPESTESRPKLFD